ncbi:DUF4282 domain-containing protein [Thiomonas bhubaneswarensis]|uniref:DUF4282 domain-containing protein n=1 Tax=Thiomonas bhubaneswarensis TaxID=339866 RepID=A0A0K6I2F8_9BURK|nr:DUF4282 domain-containing protein [Thiomonas bhubaneswarensis]CUA97315.1 Domain of unknown function (DUF4282) [Thiomonas bhubaneswarensis]
MQALADFFSFRTFISLDVLRVVYALGAIGMPLMAWALWLWLRRYALWNWMRRAAEQTTARVVPRRWRLAGMVLFVMCFLCMELMWRMMFEFIIAYLQMRDALQELARGSGTS